MKDPTPDQIDGYRREGFVLLERFLNSDDLVRRREVVDDEVAQRLATTGEQSDEYYWRDASFERLAIGDALEDDAVNPLVWSR